MPAAIEENGGKIVRFFQQVGREPPGKENKIVDRKQNENRKMYYFFPEI